MKIDQLFTFFDSYVPLSPEEKHDLSTRVKERKLKRKEFFLQDGQVCHHYGFVLEGCFKTYGVDKSGKEHNLQFAVENDWIADISSFYSEKPSKLFIESLSSQEISMQISYQIKERLPLTKSPNELLSKTIEESADYYRNNTSIEWAIELYAIAIGYTANDKTADVLWKKIDTSRVRLIMLKNQGKVRNVAGYLYKSNWKKSLNNIIDRWHRYVPYYYKGEVINFENL